MTDNTDESLFFEAFADIRPLKQDTLPVPRHQAEESASLRKDAINLTSQLERNCLTSGYVQPVDPLDVIEYKKAGVQHEVYKKLRGAKYPLSASLNISQMTIEQARKAVFLFIIESQQKQYRCVHIKHGIKACRDGAGILLKSYLNAWLPNLNSVLAFHSAPQHLAGLGATIILLKKSDEEKRETRERIQKRCG